MTRSLPSVLWVKDVRLDSGATIGGGGDGGGGVPGCLRTGGGSRGVIATTRGPLTSEKDLRCREAEISRPVALLIRSDRSPAVAVSVSPDSVAAGFAPPTAWATWSKCSTRLLAGQT